MINIDAIKARLVRATPGPWRLKPQDPAKIHRGTVQIEEDGRAIEVVAECYCGAYEGHGLHNADLIAHAPTDLDALVAEVERLRAEVERERVAVVSALERWAEDGGDPWMSHCADRIKSGEHRREETE
jgi:hypothetical protein